MNSKIPKSGDCGPSTPPVVSALEDMQLTSERHNHNVSTVGATSGALLDSQEPIVALDLPDRPFKLEVAAGERPTSGFVHHDGRALPDIEIVCDARSELLEIVGHGGASEIRALHILEHFPYPETSNVLNTWRTMLARGHSIHIEVPNLAWQIEACASGQITADEFVHYAYGAQDYPGNFHFAGFTEEILSNRLHDSGFDQISITNIGQVLVATARNPS